MFFYFIPTEQTSTCPPELLAEFMLDGVIDTPELCPVRSGPAGQPGIVVVDRSLSKTPIRYRPNEQIWRQSFDTDAWIGYEAPTPPRMHTLARANMLPGRRVRLCSGEQIEIPIARRYIEADGHVFRTTALPKSLGRDQETGQWVPKDVVAKYKTLDNLLVGYTEALAEAYQHVDDDAPIVRFEYAPLPDLIVAAIAANYRVGPDEVDILGIYDQTLNRAIVDVLLDTATTEAWATKKKAATTSAGLTSSAGPTPSTPAGQ